MQNAETEHIGEIRSNLTKDKYSGFTEEAHVFKEQRVRTVNEP